VNTFESSLAVGIDLALEGKSSQKVKDKLHTEQNGFMFDGIRSARLEQLWKGC
jgi:hypothetical protein